MQKETCVNFADERQENDVKMYNYFFIKNKKPFLSQKSTRIQNYSIFSILNC